MKRPFGLLLSVLMLATSAHAADPGFVVHKRVSEVRLTLVATDSAGRPWRGLAASNLAVSDGGDAVADFELRSADDLPLQVGIVLDLSDSTLKSWPAVRSALMASMEGLVRPGDQLLMTSFSNHIEFQAVLNHPQEIVESLPSSTGGLTALYDALYRTCEHPLFSEGGEPRRSAIILFSDGEDNLSYRGLPETIAAAQQNGIAIYTITTHKPNQVRDGDAILHRLASASGGRDFVVKDTNGLKTALQAIQDELRNSYLLYYHPLSDAAGFRRVEVLPSRNANLRLRTRAGYYPAP